MKFDASWMLFPNPTEIWQVFIYNKNCTHLRIKEYFTRKKTFEFFSTQNLVHHSIQIDAMLIQEGY